MALQTSKMCKYTLDFTLIVSDAAAAGPQNTRQAVGQAVIISLTSKEIDKGPYKSSKARDQSF